MSDAGARPSWLRPTAFAAALALHAAAATLIVTRPAPVVSLPEIEVSLDNAPPETPSPAAVDSPAPAPTEAPTPAETPTPVPTETPTPPPADTPTPTPTETPTPTPSETPTPIPTEAPTPTPIPTKSPAHPRARPSPGPSPRPTAKPAPHVRPTPSASRGRLERHDDFGKPRDGVARPAEPSAGEVAAYRSRLAGEIAGALAGYPGNGAAVLSIAVSASGGLSCSVSGASAEANFAGLCARVRGVGAGSPPGGAFSLRLPVRLHGD